VPQNHTVSRSRASGILAAAALAATLTACAESDSESAAPPVAELPPIVTTPAPTPVPTDPSAFPTTAASSTPEPTAAPLPDGRHPALITGIDVSTRQVTVDIVQFFTGTAAATAAQEDGAAEVPPPNDYWVRNKNNLLRTLTVASDLRITVNTLAAAETGNSRKDAVVSLEKLASYPSREGRLFWVTVSGNVITVIAEQFLP
jgi:hypothetical protein